MLAEIPSTISEQPSCSWLQRVFGYCPESLPTPSVISEGPAAPLTRSELETWTPEQMYAHTIAEQEKARAGYTSGTGGTTGGQPASKCAWYQAESSDGTCELGGMLFWISVIGGGLLAAGSLMGLRRHR